MDSFLFPLVAVFLASLGGYDQLLVARFSALSGQGRGLLAAALVACVISAGAMAWAGEMIAALLPGSAQTMLIGFALLVAALELFWPVRMKIPSEPTRSLGAFMVVLLTRQIGDAARFVIFAFAAATVFAPLAGLGGAIGGSAALILGWSMGEKLELVLRLRVIRCVLGGVTLALAMAIMLGVRGIL